LNIEKKLKELPELENQLPLIFKEYQQIIAQLRFISLSLLDSQETIDLIKNNFDLLLNLCNDPYFDYDLAEQLKLRLITLSFFDDEILRVKLEKALRSCDLKITSEKIILLDKKTVNPSLANWIIDYDQRLYDKQDRALARIEYLSNSSNVVKLSVEEKEKIKKMISFYDFINTSSLIPSGYASDIPIQWPDGMIQIVSGGELFTVNQPPKSVPSMLEKKPSPKSSERSIFEDKYLEEESGKDER